jgi:hypothetical protein
MSEPFGGRIELADLISTLRDELDLAQQRARNTSPQLVVQGIDLEVSFTYTREAGATGAVKFWVLEAGAEGKLGSERVHKVTVHLGPRDGGVIEVDRAVTSRPR